MNTHLASMPVAAVAATVIAFPLVGAAKGAAAGAILPGVDAKTGEKKE